MSGLSRDERERLADALHDGMDGGRLIGAGKGIGMLGNDVPLGEARSYEVVWWAVERVAPVVAALAEARVTVLRERAVHECGKSVAAAYASGLTDGDRRAAEYMAALARNVRGER